MILFKWDVSFQYSNSLIELIVKVPAIALADNLFLIDFITIQSLEEKEEGRYAVNRTPSKKPTEPEEGVNIISI